MTDLEKIYNSTNFYIERLFQDGLLDNATDLGDGGGKSKYFKRLFYFIDLKNIYIQGLTSKGRKHQPTTKFEGNHTHEDRIGNMIIETLYHIIFDYRWQSNEDQYSILNVIESGFLKNKPTYIALNFFTQNPGDYDLDAYALGKIKDKGWLADLFKYTKSNDLKSTDESRSFDNNKFNILHDLVIKNLIIVNITINYTGPYCCNENMVTDHFKDSLRSNVVDGITGFKDIRDTDITSNNECNQVPVVGDSQIENANLKLPRNIPIRPSIIDFIAQLINLLDKNEISGNKQSIKHKFHTLQSYDDSLLLKWYIYFYNYFFNSNDFNRFSDNVYLSILSGDKFKSNGDNFSEVNDMFTENDDINKYYEVRDKLFDYLKLKYGNDFDVSKENFDGNSLWNTYKKINNKTGKMEDVHFLYRDKLMDFYNINKALIDSLSIMPFMERSVAYELKGSGRYKGDFIVSQHQLVEDVSSFTGLTRPKSPERKSHKSTNSPQRKSPKSPKSPNSPQRKSPQRKSPERISPNSPQRNSPNSLLHNSPPRKSPNSPQRNSPQRNSPKIISIFDRKLEETESSLERYNDALTRSSDIKNYETIMKNYYKCNNDINNAVHNILSIRYYYNKNQKRYILDIGKKDYFIENRNILIENNFFPFEDWTDIPSTTYNKSNETTIDERNNYYNRYIRRCKNLNNYFSKKEYSYLDKRGKRTIEFYNEFDVMYDQLVNEDEDIVKNYSLVGGEEVNDSKLILSVKLRKVKSKNILTSTYVNFLPIINPGIGCINFSYTEANYSHTDEDGNKIVDWLIHRP